MSPYQPRFACRRSFLPLLLLAGALAGQGPLAVGIRDTAWPNTTGQGSSSLAARVLYPAAVAGTNVPVLPRVGGWPVIVFLHGFATPGTTYGTLGNAWASQGFVVVLNNTATFDNQGQEYDGRALFPAVVAANTAVGGPFAGAIDVQRIGLAGHSMGGGNVGNVLAGNPGYRCGFAFAPVTPRGGNAALVDVPFGIVVGAGDTIAPAATYAQPFHASLTGVQGLKFLYLLNGDCTHTNVAGLFVTSGTGTAVFERAAGVGLGFFRHFLGIDPLGLEQALGATAVAEPRLLSLAQEIETPQLFAATPLRLGQTTRLSVATEPGTAGVLAAAALAPSQPTPFGDLRLDQGSAFLAIVGIGGPTRRLDGQVAVPADPGFLGLQIALQGFGQGRAGSLRLGNAFGLTVQP